MTDTSKIRRLIKDFNFDSLFEELGWDRFKRELPIVVDDVEYGLTGVREKRGFQVFHYLVPAGEPFPSAAVMTKVQRAVAKTAHENIVIFSDEAQTRQCFRVARRDEGKLLRSTGLDFHKGHSGEALAQRISKLAISLDEEEDLTLVDVTNRASELYAERVTKRFFTKFQQQRDAFKDFIKGIKDVQQREWYASLMLNRLMFVYFVQKKGFLDHDLDYLKNRLAKSREVNKEFHAFYRYFLLKLFHDGLNKREADRDPDLEKLLGQVPYLNGGIFDQHRIETENKDIKIPDKAFESLFAFFDEYKWHLDDRPLRDDTEINPDVLGYIFEKYINQKQMGAYYTKEDITEYISKNTIIPYLFDEAARRNTEPFRPEREVWGLLRDDPDRYIYDAVGHGIFVDIHTRTGPNTCKELEKPIPIPGKIKAGIKDVAKRTDWNTAAPAEVALPTETWGEHIARRDRCIELRKKLAAGAITSINDMIAHNLDIRQFAVDVIDNCESADLLRAIYFTIAGRMEQVGKNHKAQLPLSVLDPTCGSGAFLFAALNILQPLYEACLSKMEQFVNEADQAQPVTIEDEMAALIELGESNTLEFKSTARFDVKKSKAIEKLPEGKQLEILKATDKDRQHDILKAVAAMLNAKGGDLVIGVDDEGNGFGIHHDYMFFSEDGKRNRDGYELWLTSLLISNFGKTAAGCVEISFALRDGVDVCRLKTSPSPDPVFVKKDGAEVFYRRLNNSSQTLGMEEFAKYRDSRFKGDPPVRVEPKLKLGKSAKKSGKKKLIDFRDILAEIETHPNQTYFVLKSIVINNLFGVDIMPEAVEICKLRLFLKLMSTVEPHYAQNNLGVEALPDIDFNVRAGNTLVGYTTLAQIEQSLSGTLGFEDGQITGIRDQAKVVALKFELFRREQTDLGGKITEANKKDLAEELNTLTLRLDKFLSEEYAVDPRKEKDFNAWKSVHQPFHWFAEFFAIMQAGGFDVIVGNPPYLEAREIDYAVQGLETTRSQAVHAMCIERSLRLVKEHSWISMIVPLAIVSTQRFSIVQQMLESTGETCYANFAWRPAKLFDAVNRALTIFITGSKPSGRCFSSGYTKWYSDARAHLIPTIQYKSWKSDRTSYWVPKLTSDIDVEILQNLLGLPNRFGEFLIDRGRENQVFYRTTGGLYWKVFTDFPPEFSVNGKPGKSSRQTTLSLREQTFVQSSVALLSSNLFWWWYTMTSNLRDLNPTDIKAFPTCESVLKSDALSALGADYIASLQENSQTLVRNQRSTGRTETQSFLISKSKGVIDKIDEELGPFYGLNYAQVSYIQSFDIKFRMGTDD